MGRIKKAIAITTLVASAVSYGIMERGTHEQVACFNGLEHHYGVSDFAKLPDYVIDQSGCLNWENTLGLGGMALGTSIEFGLGVDLLLRRLDSSSESVELKLTAVQ